MKKVQQSSQDQFCLRKKDYIDELESNFVEVDGKPMGYQRYSPPYKATYYDDYDAWMVIVNGIYCLEMMVSSLLFLLQTNLF